MTRHEIQRVEILDDGVIDLLELIACTHVDRTRIVEMADVGLIDPIGADVNEWCFAARDLRRLRLAERLCVDLGVNLPGAALILDLIEERDALLSQVALLRRHIEEF